MPDRIEALRRATHRLSDSSAHALRTPLTRRTRLAQKLSRMAGTDALRADFERVLRSMMDSSFDSD